MNFKFGRLTHTIKYIKPSIICFNVLIIIQVDCASIVFIRIIISESIIVSQNNLDDISAALNLYMESVIKCWIKVIRITRYLFCFIFILITKYNDTKSSALINIKSIIIIINSLNYSYLQRALLWWIWNQFLKLFL